MALGEWARKHRIAFSSRRELVSHPEVVRFYEQRIRDHSAELANYEQIARFTLLDEPFTIDGGEVTPTMKLKRKVINQHFGPTIDAMYQKIARQP